MSQVTKTGDATMSIGTIAFASAIGTTIEWYDFFLYNTMTALVLNKLFFPNADILVSTLLAYVTSFVGFLSRPIGGVIFGHYGDRIGRKTVLILTRPDHGRRHVPDRAIADLRNGRRLGAAHAAGTAHLPGHRHRRRMGRRRADGGRAFAGRTARLLRQLAADRRAGGTAARSAGVVSLLSFLEQ